MSASYESKSTQLVANSAAGSRHSSHASSSCAAPYAKQSHSRWWGRRHHVFIRGASHAPVQSISQSLVGSSSHTPHMSSYAVPPHAPAQLDTVVVGRHRRRRTCQGCGTSPHARTIFDTGPCCHSIRAIPSCSHRSRLRCRRRRRRRRMGSRRRSIRMRHLRRSGCRPPR